MGVGRSGTTAVYGLLQHILEASFPSDVDYVYEPFLWDRMAFNKQYKDLTDEFSYAASLSVEGMYHHRRLPILVTEGHVPDQTSKDWLVQTLRPLGGKRCYLGKMIRANGRIRLIREVAPDTKIIFFIRNPLDVLNSAAQLFSFFGSEFHESDLERFKAEVRKHFGRDMPDSTIGSSSIEAEYWYWYFSNQFFLQYAQKNPQDLLSVAYEAYVENRETTVQRICEFVGVDFEPHFAIASREKLGPVQHSHSALTQTEFAFLQQKVSEYGQMLSLVDIVPDAPVSSLIKTTQWSSGSNISRPTRPYNGLHLSRLLMQKEAELRDMTSQLSQLRDAHVRLRDEKSWLADELTAVRSSTRYRFINRALAPLDALKKHRSRRRDS